MILTRTEFKRMIAQTRVLGIMGQRDRLILRVLFETRITVAELIRLRRCDISMTKHTLCVRGLRARMLTLDRSLCSRITFYRDALLGQLGNDDAHDALFPYEIESPFTVRRLRALLDHYRRAAGVEECVQR